jgi:hypothetical protein
VVLAIVAMIFFLCFDLSLDVAPASPFIASKGRGQVKIMVKR